MMILGKTNTTLKNHTSYEEKNNSNYSNTPNNEGDHNEEYLSATVFSIVDNPQTLPEISLMEENNNLTGSNNAENEIVGYVSSSNLEISEQESDGLHYIMGYLGYKFSAKYPNLCLGKHTYQITDDHTYGQPPSFIRHLSLGGLFEPSENFIKQGNKMEIFFLKLNPEGNLSKKSGIVASISHEIQNQLPDLPSEIIKCFSKTRVIVRMRFLNMKMKTENLRKSKRKYSDPHSKHVKKLRKIVN